MEAVWTCLYASYRGVLESGGGNEYIRHSGLRSAKASGKDVTKVQRKHIKEAEKTLKELKERLEKDEDSCASDSGDDDGDSSESDSE